MLSALALLLVQAAPETAQTRPIPPIETAREQIAELDAKLFWAAFEGCEPESLEPLLTEDFRMLHDLAGLPLSSRAGFIANFKQQCADRAAGGQHEGYKNRRLLVPGSRTVTPLGSWGVLERGHHTFHELRQRPAGFYGAEDPGGPSWVQTGGAHFIHVWKWIGTEGRFRLQESISVDHGAAVPYPPEAATGN